jgi:Domain of unknown function DUF11
MEVISADLKIQSMACNGVQIKGSPNVTVTTSITVHNDNDDNARHVQVVVVLPPTSRVISSTLEATQGAYSGAVVGPSYPPSAGSPWATNGYVIFAHPETMNVNSTFNMTLVTEMLDTYASKPLTAFVFGSLPDPNPGNNYRTTPIKIVTK